MEEIKQEIPVDQVAVETKEEGATKPKKQSKKVVTKDVSVPSVEAVKVKTPESEIIQQENVVVDDSNLIPDTIQEVVTAVEQTITSSEQTVVEIVESFMAKEKPWYLSSSHIYVLVKNAVVSIPYSQNIFDKSLLALCTTTGYITKSTHLNVVLETKDCYQLVAKLDETVSGLLVRADDGFDALREKLSISLQELSVAISVHTAWAEQFTKQSVSGLTESSAEVAVAMKTRYEKTLDLIRVALALAKDKVYEHAGNVKDSASGYVSDKYNSSVGAAKSAVSGVQTRVTEVHTQVDSTVMSALVGALKAAQPYVHSAVTTSTPYLVQAVEASQPYVDRAMPYIDPLVARVSDINAALSEHQVVGPYVTLAEETAIKALEGAKVYCTPEVKV